MGCMGTLRFGPRKGVFSVSLPASAPSPVIYCASVQATGEYEPVRSSPAYAVVGTMILWWAWFAFNAGSVETVATDGREVIAALAATNTAVAAGAGGMTAVALDYLTSRGHQFDVFRSINGVLGVRFVRLTVHSVLEFNVRRAGPGWYHCGMRLYEPMGGSARWNYFIDLRIRCRANSDPPPHR